MGKMKSRLSASATLQLPEVGFVSGTKGCGASYSCGGMHELPRDVHSGFVHNKQNTANYERLDCYLREVVLHFKISVFLQMLPATQRDKSRS